MMFFLIVTKLFTTQNYHVKYPRPLHNRGLDVYNFWIQPPLIVLRFAAATFLK